MSDHDQISLGKRSNGINPEICRPVRTWVGPEEAQELARHNIRWIGQVMERIYELSGRVAR